MSLSKYRILQIPTSSEKFEPYRALVIDNWLYALKYNSDFYRDVEGNIYFPMYRKLLGNLLLKSRVVARVAVLEDDHDVVLGWCIYEGPALHFVYVKNKIRKQGIGTDLVPEGAEFFTHMTKPWRKLWQSNFKYMKFNPF